MTESPTESPDELAHRWSTLPPFRTLPSAALRTRLTLPVSGSPPVAASGIGGLTATHLTESPVDFLGHDPRWWPLIPVWPVLEDLQARLCRAAERIGVTRAADVAGAFLHSIQADVRRLVVRAATEELPAGPGGESAASAALRTGYGARDAAARFADRHAPLLCQVRHVLLTHCGAYELALRRLRDEWDQLRHLLPPDAAPDRLSAVHAVGDLHERGAVLRLDFTDGNHLLYKPRSLALEVALAGFFRWIDTHRPGLAPAVPRSYDAGDHGWQAYVGGRDSADRAEVAGFYRRAGALIAAAYLLRGTDLHHENVVCDGHAPVIVDPECLFGGSFRTTADGVREMAGTKAATVLDTALLPDPGKRGDAPQALDFTFLGATAQRRGLALIRTLDEAGTGLVTRPAAVAPARHVPTIDGEPVPAAPFADAVVGGFTEAYRLFLDRRGALEAALDAFRTVRVRHIVRPTWQYVRLLAELGHPEATRSAIRQEEVINTLWLPNAHERGLAVALFTHERRVLLRGGVPTFSRRADGVDLLDHDTVVYRNALHVSGYDLVRQRLARLSDEDLAVQARIVRTALGLLNIAPDAKSARRYAPTAAPLPDAPALTALASAVRDALRRDRARLSGRSWWLTGDEVGDGMFSVRPSPIGLYQGLAGIALFAGYHELVTGEHTDLAASALDAMRIDTEALLEHSTCEQLGRNQQLGVFGGVFGAVYTAACLGVSRGDAALVDWARSVSDRVTAAVPHLPAWDLGSGTAGVAVVAAELAGHLGDAGFRPAAEKALEVTAARLEEVLRREALPTGVAHGLSGAALAFERGARSLGVADYAAAARVCAEAENTRRTSDAWADYLLADDAVRHEGWCRGAGGIGLARLVAGGGSPADVAVAVRATQKRAFGNDHSLCHGALGAVEFLRAAGRAGLARPDLARAALGGVVRAGVSRGWQTGLPPGLPDPGLFTGLAGVGFGLLRQLAPNDVPQVLTLNLPGDAAAAPR